LRSVREGCVKYTITRLEDTDSRECWLCGEAPRAEYRLEADGESFELCARCARMTQALADILVARFRKDGQS
jgi:hypothetical protein